MFITLVVVKNGSITNAKWDTIASTSSSQFTAHLLRVNVFMPLISRVMYIQKYMAQSASLRGEAVLLLALEGGVGLDAVGRGALGRHQPLGPRALALSHPSSSTRQRTVEGDRSGEGRGEGAHGQARAGIGTEGRRGEGGYDACRTVRTSNSRRHALMASFLCWRPGRDGGNGGT